MKPFSKVQAVKSVARERLGSPRPTRVFDDHDFGKDICRYCKADPCMCDEMYDAWRDRELEKELNVEPEDEYERRTR